jgi:hypothetical protein
MQLSLNPSSEGVVYTFIKLNKNSQSQSRTQHLKLHQLVQTLLQGMACDGGRLAKLGFKTQNVAP